MGLRTWRLRRAMGRLRIDDEVVPGDLLPVGEPTVLRAWRTRAASQLAPDWVWPYWLERQVAPDSPAFVPRGQLPFLANVTHRNWTMVGNLDSRWEAIVDTRGLVTPWSDGWSLDWWIGGEDRWHLPAREAGVRQGLRGDAPVVETRMRVPGGDAVHRAYAVRAAAGHGVPGELVVVEIENATRTPFAVALAVRPYNPDGLSVIQRIELHGTTLTVDGRPAVLLPKAPGRVAASTFRSGDSALEVFAGRAGDRFPPGLRCPAGMAQAALLFPLAHGATLRVGIPLVPGRRRRRQPVARSRAATRPALPAALPTSEQVAAGWAGQARRGMRLELPDPRLQSAVDANRCYLLLLHDGDDVTPGPATGHRFTFRDAAYLLAALDRYGFHDEVAQVLASYPARQQADGCFSGHRQESDANGCALWSIAHHWRLARDRQLVETLAPALARGMAWIDKARSRGRGRRRDDPALQGLLPAGTSAEHGGPPDHFYWDDFWGVAGMAAGAELLGAIGEPLGAAQAHRAAEAFLVDVLASLDRTAAALGTAAMPAGPRRRIDPGSIGTLVACEPLGILAAGDPRVAATADVIRERFLQGAAFFEGTSHTGLGTHLTLRLAAVELAAGDRRALHRLVWMLDAATPTWTWPEAVHPRLPGGCMGDGHHGRAAAELLSFVRALLVREAGGGLALASMVPDGWLGQGWEVHGAPTAHGRLSYGVRWHGERPALLWELDPHPGSRPVLLTAPGLDPGWSSSEPRGEALLQPVAAAADRGPEPAPGASFG